MKTLYWKFMDWMSTLSMEEVFIFTGVSILVFCVIIGIPLSLYIVKKQEEAESTKNNEE